MKILLCHNFYQQPGGERIVVLALQSLLEQQGHEVISYAEDNLEITHYSRVQKAGFFPRTLFSERTYRRVRQIAAREKPDIAHIHNVFPLISPAIYVALHKAGVPTVQSIHNYRLMCINGLFLRNGQVCERCKDGQFFSGFRFKCYRDSYALSGLYALSIGGHRRLGTFDKIDRFIASTKFAAEKLVESGVAPKRKISILGNFLPEPVPDYGVPDLQAPYITYVGRLSGEKGIFTLLDALRELPRVRLKVVGSGPLQEEVRLYVERHRLENIDLLGFVSEEEKLAVLRGALACVMPSECYEVFPLVLLESAAVGTPVIASRIGSLATLIAEGSTGLLFRPGDSADLRATLERLVAAPEMAVQMGRQARTWLEADHTPEAHHRALMTIYQQVIR